MLYNKKIKPSLIDQNIIGEYMKEKLSQQMIGSGVQSQSELKKLSTKIFYNIVYFIYHYFFIILILSGIIYYMYNRYLWYQEIKKNQAKKEDQTKKYFDEIMNETISPTVQNIAPSIVPTPNPVKLSQSHVANYFMPGKKLDKVVEGNNGYLNHMKQTWDTTQAHKSSMGRFDSNIKTVRFALGDFDAYGRNNINPKTGETLVRPVYIEPSHIQAYESAKTSPYSQF